MNTIKTFYKVRNPRKIFIVGDFNLSTVTWPRTDVNALSDGIDKSFVDSFDELGLHQCVTEPTHIKGRILDLLLTNNKNMLSSTNIVSDDSICSSDHFTLYFEVKTKVVHKKPLKRTILISRRLIGMR